MAVLNAYWLWLIVQGALALASKDEGKLARLESRAPGGQSHRKQQ